MAIFDALIDDVAQRFGLGANAGPLIREGLTLITGVPGGIGGFLNLFKSAGLSSEVASWLGQSNAAPLAAQQLEKVLGASAIGSIATRLGLGQAAVSGALGYGLPKLDRPTDAERRHPDQPARGSHQVHLRRRARSPRAASTSTRRRTPRPRSPPRRSTSTRRRSKDGLPVWLWPLAAALILLAGWWLWPRPVAEAPVAQAPVTAPAPVATVAPVATPAPATGAGRGSCARAPGALDPHARQRERRRSLRRRGS